MLSFAPEKVIFVSLICGFRLFCSAAMFLMKVYSLQSWAAPRTKDCQQSQRLVWRSPGFCGRRHTNLPKLLAKVTAKTWSVKILQKEISTNTKNSELGFGLAPAWFHPPLVVVTPNTKTQRKTWNITHSCFGLCLFGGHCHNKHPKLGRKAPNTKMIYFKSQYR